jgi:TonB family protein
MKMLGTRLLMAAALFLASPFSVLQGQQDPVVNDKDMLVSHVEDVRYPPIARQTRIAGVVVVRVKLDGDGKVVEASAISGHEILVPDSIANARKWRFRPNARGTAVIVYNYRISDVCLSETVGYFSTVQSPNFVTIVGCPFLLQ